MGAGEFVKLSALAKSHAEKALANEDARLSRIYRDHESEFYALAKNGAGVDAARLAAAMTYEVEAETYLRRNPPSYFTASDSLAKGIEALRRAHADADLVTKLKGRLREYQLQSKAEMTGHEIQIDREDIDLSKAIDQIQTLVTHDDLLEALKLLSFARSLTSYEEVKNEVIKLAQDHPLSHFIGASILDNSGRVQAHLKSLHPGEGNQEEALEGRIFRHASEFLWRFRAQVYIEPARRKIWDQHFPSEGEFDFLVTNNPFVPPGHEGIFSRGIYYGLCGDMLLAAHLLAPQVENSIRHVLEQRGVDVSNLDSDLTQQVKTLGPLLSLPETKQIFGPEYIFEFRGLLIEKLGYSFRHRIAHGFVSEGACYGPECSNLWWLVVRLCCTPFMYPESEET